MRNGPVLIDLDEAQTPVLDVSAAPAVPDPVPRARAPAAMERAAAASARPGSGVLRWFGGLSLALILAILSTAAWDFAAAMMARNLALGAIVSALLAALGVLALLLCLREVAALGRLSRIDGLRRQAKEARELAQARQVTSGLRQLYKGRKDMRWGLQSLSERSADAFDAATLLAIAEDCMLSAPDRAARREVESTARQVATVTAFVPLAMADVVAALIANMRMIRRIAEIYGGHSGVLGSWRLTRLVLAHLAATGAISAADDMIEPLLGGSILSKLSRRFGEGLVNGALTARVGVVAIELCRPLPFAHHPPPAAGKVIASALSGLIGKGK